MDPMRGGTHATGEHQRSYEYSLHPQMCVYGERKTMTEGQQRGWCGLCIERHTSPTCGLICSAPPSVLCDGCQDIRHHALLILRLRLDDAVIRRSQLHQRLRHP